MTVSVPAETFRTMDTDTDGVISLNFFQVRPHSRLSADSIISDGGSDGVSSPPCSLCSTVDLAHHVCLETSGTLRLQILYKLFPKCLLSSSSSSPLEKHAVASSSQCLYRTRGSVLLSGAVPGRVPLFFKCCRSKRSFIVRNLCSSEP